jgi:hypothetical protein
MSNLTTEHQDEVQTAQSVIEREVDMGFFENYLSENAIPGSINDASCRRIAHCSCDCDKCAVFN